MPSKIEIENASKKLIKELKNFSEEELSRLVLLHNKKYFEDDAPEISDEAFDKLVEALRFKNKSARALDEIGHKEKIFASDFGDEVVHQSPMLSLEKCYDDESFFKWSEKIQGDLVAMPKIDGVACSLIYDARGKVRIAATRGDGKRGENITKNVVLIASIPKKLDEKILLGLVEEKGEVEVRGEVYLSLERFNRLFADQFANPRNLCAGALKQKDPKKSQEIGLSFFPYDLKGTNLTTEEEKFLVLERLGFSMMPYKRVKNDPSATQYYKELFSKRKDIDYEVDGVVFRANELSDQLRLGETSHHPKFALAYKFQGESAQTELIDVLWSLARSGVITPVAVVKPVFVSGANVSKASLHNYGMFKSLNLHESSLVEINRRGGVIPHLERVLMSKGKPLQPPKVCPSCHKPIIIDGDFIYCSDKKHCHEVVVANLAHFCATLGMEGLGEKIIRKFFDEKLIKNFADIFALTKEEILKLDRMGDVLAQKLIDEINAHRNVELSLFLQALGIHELGKNVAELLAENFHNLFEIRKAKVSDIVAIHGFGEKIAESVVKGLSDLNEEIDSLLKWIVVKDYQTKPLSHSNSALANKSVVFTGKMAHLDRKKAQELVKSLGGKTPGAMSSKINFLVVGDDGSPLISDGKKSSKQKAAEKLIEEGAEIKIISESDFLKMTEE